MSGTLLGLTARTVVERPVFFIGMPRSGTTIIFEAVAAHEHLGWLSNYSNRFPAVPCLTSLHRLFFGAQGKKEQDREGGWLRKVLPEPSEVYNVWESFFGRKFAASFLTGCTSPKSEAERCVRYVERLLWAQGKKRFCAKLTGPPRVRFLADVFPDALFVDVVRDPRAVVRSLLRVDFWKRGLSAPYWDGALSERQAALWKRTGRSPVALAALQWCSVYERTVEEIGLTGNPYLRIRYEDFVREPAETVEGVLEFCGLGSSRRVDLYLRGQDYSNRNRKYREELATDDVRLIEQIAGSSMKELGYLE